MFVQLQNTLCIQATALFEDLSVVSYDYYHKLCQRNKIEKIQSGGNGRKALISYDSLPDRYKTKIKEILGYDPKQKHKTVRLEKFIRTDESAREYFAAYRRPDGRALSPAKQEEYSVNAEVYRALDECDRETKAYRKARKGSTRGVWEGVVSMLNKLDPEKHPHSISGHQRTVRRNLKKFKSGGYEALIPGYVGNTNSAKIKGEVAEWLLAQYCLPIKYTIPEVSNLYAQYVHDNRDLGFPLLSESGISAYLNKPETRRLWVLARHGKTAWMNEYGHTLKRDRTQWFPNCWWGIDGTKLDVVHYYDNALKMAAQARINPVIDIYSEKIIGWSLSRSESHVDHFTALKSAINNTGYKPIEFSYDSQSGHKSARMQKLYDNIVATGGRHYKHKIKKNSAGDGSPIEGIFRRLQQQVISKLWFSDKQSPTVKRLDNKPNMDFIQRHKEKLPTFEELEQIWLTIVNNWNAAKHPKFDVSRNEVYLHKMDMSEQIDQLDAMSIFMIEETKGNKYTRSGIQLNVAHKRYDYEVYNDDGTVDIEFRKYNIGKRFIVKYDPTSLDTYVALYEETDHGLAFNTYAEPKRAHETIETLKTDDDRAWLRKDQQVLDYEFSEVEAELDALRKRTGITEDAMIEDQELMIKMGGTLRKEDRNEVEASILDRL